MARDTEPEELPETAQQQLRALTATAQRMVDELHDAGPTDQTLKTMNLLKQLILGNASLELQLAKQSALRTEKQVAYELGHDELRLSVYESLLEGLSTPEGIERMQHSIGAEVRAMRAAGVDWKRPMTTHDEDD